MAPSAAAVGRFYSAKAEFLLCILPKYDRLFPEETPYERNARQ